MAQHAAQSQRSAAGKTEFTGAFSSFSVSDIPEAKRFYGDTLGLDVSDGEEGSLKLDVGGQSLFIYPKPDHQSATFTVLNLTVDDIASAVAGLTEQGIEFESYSGDIKTDDSGIMWGKRDNRGPNIAWFRDPAGNIISVIED